MKLTFFTNACCMYEYGGFRLLADPWLSESAFEGAWIHNPPIKTRPQDLLDVDAIYISHLHQDHMDIETLKYFRRGIPILTLGDKYSFCAKKLRDMGFSHVVEVKDKDKVVAGPFRVTMFAPFKKHPFVDCQVGNVVDSAMLIEVGLSSVLNCNDNTMDVESAKSFVSEFGIPTVAQLNWNNASEYPCCFLNLSHEEKLAEHHRCIDRNLAHMAEIGLAVKARHIMPFAGAFKLSKKWEHMNEYLGATTDEHAVEYLQAKGLRAFRLAEGETFHVE